MVWQKCKWLYHPKIPKLDSPFQGEYLCNLAQLHNLARFMNKPPARIRQDVPVEFHPIWRLLYINFIFSWGRLLQTMRGGPMCEQSLRPCLWAYWGMVGKTMVMVFTSVFTMVFTLFDHGFRWFYHLCSDSRAIDQVLGFPSLLVHYWVFTPCHVEPHRVDTLILL